MTEAHPTRPKTSPVTDDPRSRIVLPLTCETVEAAHTVVQAIQPPEIGAYWIPASLFYADGGDFAVELTKHAHVILNLGLHDIPSQLTAVMKQIDRRFASRACKLGVTIHAESGVSGINECARIGRNLKIDVIAHTKLPYAANPISGHIRDFYGHDVEPQRIAFRMARLALNHGCQGVILSWDDLPDFSEPVQEEFNFAADQDCYAYAVPDSLAEDRRLHVAHAVKAGATRFILEWQPFSIQEGARMLGRELIQEWPKSPIHKEKR